ncbi:uncharacterized protein LOC113315517 [Papaver somniferum]|uniref:uncharacterized protein LOC113315517 n=1 Tax=Papaver somniferum TaxID=3469 RepID=UPI000E704181|nr:uncharacterized protein LOC113315517 [Papaver somniferum]
MVLKIDFEKAYDRLEWSFIYRVFEALGFNSVWIHWLKLCISSVSFQVLFNGAPNEVFYPSRGILQGNPLSPYIFIIYMEVLSRIINQGIETKQIFGFRIYRQAPMISHSFYADDSMIFLEANLRNVRGIKTILDRFPSWSCQLVNTSKSVVVCSKNLPRRLARNLCRGLHIQLGTSPGKYLGINIQWGRLSHANSTESLVKITNRLSGWKNKSLNFGGRDVLIKSVLDPSLNHLMCTMKLPKFILCKIDKLGRNFLWQHWDGTNRIHAISWGKVCKPVWFGGLGIRDLEFHNFSFLAKSSWRIACNPDSLVVKLFQAKYHRNTQFWEALPPSRVSWCWRSILRGKELIKTGLKWVIETAHQVNIWNDSWCCNVPLSQILGPTCDPSLRVSDLIDPGNHEWNLSPISSSIPKSVQDQILAIPLSRHVPSSDHRVWTHRRDGNVSVKSCYNWLALSQEGSALNGTKWEHLYKSRCPARIKHFLWLLDQGKPLVRVNLSKRGLDIPVSPIWNALVYAYGVQLPQLHMCLDWIHNVLSLKTDDATVQWGPSICVPMPITPSPTFKEQICVRWLPPINDFVKLNVDGSSNDAGNAGIGGILRGDDGHFLAAFAKLIYRNSNNVAELWAIRDGMQLARNIGIQKLLVESDSQYAINLCLQTYASS